MKELTFETLWAVMQEVFGTEVFWVLVLAVVGVTLAYFYVLIRDRSVNWRKFLLAQTSLPIGAIAAVAFVLAATDSRLADMGGPIDIIMLLLIATLGAIGLAILVYTTESLLGTSRTKEGT